MKSTPWLSALTVAPLVVTTGVLLALGMVAGAPPKEGLDQQLSFDICLSKDDNASCNTCQVLSTGGTSTNNQLVPATVGDAQSSPQAPTTYNQTEGTRCH